jgi:hypothetical protein
MTPRLFLKGPLDFNEKCKKYTGKCITHFPLRTQLHLRSTFYQNPLHSHLPQFLKSLGFRLPLSTMVTCNSISLSHNLHFYTRFHRLHPTLRSRNCSFRSNALQSNSSSLQFHASTISILKQIVYLFIYLFIFIFEILMKLDYIVVF